MGLHWSCTTFLPTTLETAWWPYWIDAVFMETSILSTYRSNSAPTVLCDTHLSTFKRKPQIGSLNGLLPSRIGARVTRHAKALWRRASNSGDCRQMLIFIE